MLEVRDGNNLKFFCKIFMFWAFLFIFSQMNVQRVYSFGKGRSQGDKSMKTLVHSLIHICNIMYVLLCIYTYISIDEHRKESQIPKGKLQLG